MSSPSPAPASPAVVGANTVLAKKAKTPRKKAAPAKKKRAAAEDEEQQVEDVDEDEQEQHEDKAETGEETAARLAMTKNIKNTVLQTTEAFRLQFDDDWGTVSKISSYDYETKLPKGQVCLVCEEAIAGTCKQCIVVSRNLRDSDFGVRSGIATEAAAAGEKLLVYIHPECIGCTFLTEGPSSDTTCGCETRVDVPKTTEQRIHFSENLPVCRLHLSDANLTIPTFDPEKDRNRVISFMRRWGFVKVHTEQTPESCAKDFRTVLAGVGIVTGRGPEVMLDKIINEENWGQNMMWPEHKKFHFGLLCKATQDNALKLPDAARDMVKKSLRADPIQSEEAWAVRAKCTMSMAPLFALKENKELTDNYNTYMGPFIVIPRDATTFPYNGVLRCNAGETRTKAPETPSAPSPAAAAAAAAKKARKGTIRTPAEIAAAAAEEEGRRTPARVSDMVMVSGATFFNDTNAWTGGMAVLLAPEQWSVEDTSDPARGTVLETFKFSRCMSKIEVRAPNYGIYAKNHPLTGLTTMISAKAGEAILVRDAHPYAFRAGAANVVGMVIGANDMDPKTSTSSARARMVELGLVLKREPSRTGIKYAAVVENPIVSAPSDSSIKCAPGVENPDEARPLAWLDVFHPVTNIARYGRELFGTRYTDPAKWPPEYRPRPSDFQQMADNKRIIVEEDDDDGQVAAVATPTPKPKPKAVLTKAKSAPTKTAPAKPAAAAVAGPKAPAPIKKKVAPVPVEQEEEEEPVVSKPTPKAVVPPKKKAAPVPEPEPEQEEEQEEEEQEQEEEQQQEDGATPKPAASARKRAAPKGRRKSATAKENPDDEDYVALLRLQTKTVKGPEGEDVVIEDTNLRRVLNMDPAFMARENKEAVTKGIHNQVLVKFMDLKTGRQLSMPPIEYSEEERNAAVINFSDGLSLSLRDAFTLLKLNDKNFSAPVHQYITGLLSEPRPVLASNKLEAPRVMHVYDHPLHYGKTHIDPTPNTPAFITELYAKLNATQAEGIPAINQCIVMTGNSQKDYTSCITRNDDIHDGSLMHLLLLGKGDRVLRFRSLVPIEGKEDAKNPSPAIRMDMNNISGMLVSVSPEYINPATGLTFEYFKNSNVRKEHDTIESEPFAVLAFYSCAPVTPSANDGKKKKYVKTKKQSAEVKKAATARKIAESVPSVAEAKANKRTGKTLVEIIKEFSPLMTQWVKNYKDSDDKQGLKLVSVANKTMRTAKGNADSGALLKEVQLACGELYKYATGKIWDSSAPAPVVEEEEEDEEEPDIIQPDDDEEEKPVSKPVKVAPAPTPSKPKSAPVAKVVAQKKAPAPAAPKKKAAVADDEDDMQVDDAGTLFAVPESTRKFVVTKTGDVARRSTREKKSPPPSKQAETTKAMMEIYKQKFRQSENQRRSNCKRRNQTFFPSTLEKYIARQNLMVDEDGGKSLTRKPSRAQEFGDDDDDDDDDEEVYGESDSDSDDGEEGATVTNSMRMLEELRDVVDALQSGNPTKFEGPKAVPELVAAYAKAGKLIDANEENPTDAVLATVQSLIDQMKTKLGIPLTSPDDEEEDEESDGDHVEPASSSGKQKQPRPINLQGATVVQEGWNPSVPMEESQDFIMSALAGLQIFTKNLARSLETRINTDQMAEILIFQENLAQILNPSTPNRFSTSRMRETADLIHRAADIYTGISANPKKRTAPPSAAASPVATASASGDGKQMLLTKQGKIVPPVAQDDEIIDEEGDAAAAEQRQNAEDEQEEEDDGSPAAMDVEEQGNGEEQQQEEEEDQGVSPMQVDEQEEEEEVDDAPPPVISSTRTTVSQVKNADNDAESYTGGSDEEEEIPSPPKKAKTVTVPPVAAPVAEEEEEEEEIEQEEEEEQVAVAEEQEEQQEEEEQNENGEEEEEEEEQQEEVEVEEDPEQADEGAENSAAEATKDRLRAAQPSKEEAIVNTNGKRPVDEDEDDEEELAVVVAPSPAKKQTPAAAKAPQTKAGLVAVIYTPGQTVFGVYNSEEEAHQTMADAMTIGPDMDRSEIYTLRPLPANWKYYLTNKCVPPLEPTLENLGGVAVDALWAK